MMRPPFSTMGRTGLGVSTTLLLAMIAGSGATADSAVPQDPCAGMTAVSNTKSSSADSPARPASPAVKVSGNHLIDAAGNTLQLRGVNVSALEFVAAQGWNPADPWGGQSPDWRAIRSWKANTVRIPLNEASWLGYQCTDPAGKTRNPDPGGNYKAVVAKAVSGATAAGFYVILDLHWSAPGKFCPLAQNPMADADHSIAFWSSLAAQFKSSPNVLFELFNEPFVGYSGPVSQADWQIIMQGGKQSYYITGDNPYQANYTWEVAGMQQMLNAVRATGATNVVLIGTPSWAQDLSRWLANAPTDPLKQIGVVWHAYPQLSGQKSDNTNKSVDGQARVPKLGAVAYTWASAILDAGYPILITETGDHNAPGTTGAPYLASLLPWADVHDVSYLGWTWDVWQNPDDVLIKGAGGEPTDGYGVYFKQYLTCRAR